MLWFLTVAAAAPTFLTAEVEVDAPQPIVWEVLTDLEGYAQWNPWITEAEGTAEVGAVVWAQVVLHGDTRRVKHKVTLIEGQDQFCWKDAGASTLFVKGWRCRRLTPLPGGRTQVIVELGLAGPFKRTAIKRFGETIQQGMDAEVAALARAAESR